jgi:hypothetical protein
MAETETKLREPGWVIRVTTDELGEDTNPRDFLVAEPDRITALALVRSAGYVTDDETATSIRSAPLNELLSEGLEPGWVRQLYGPGHTKLFNQ